MHIAHFACAHLLTIIVGETKQLKIDRRGKNFDRGSGPLRLPSSYGPALCSVSDYGPGVMSMYKESGSTISDL